MEQGERHGISVEVLKHLQDVAISHGQAITRAEQDVRDLPAPSIELVSEITTGKRRL